MRSQIADAHGLEELPRWVQPLTGAVTTGIMSCAVSGMATARTLGMDSVLTAPFHFILDWGKASVFSWPLAFFLFMVCMPPIRRAIERLARALSARTDLG